jgi:GNAT superfamily N-acetyltransferase
VNQAAIEVRLELLRGAEIARHIAALATLRIAVFREWPYLYEGSLEYEARYLALYGNCPRSIAALVWDGNACVGACTALPLADANGDTQRPFVAAGYPLPRMMYFGESLLLPAYRGFGWGKRFFDVREAHAGELGLDLCTFCAVDRPSSDPRKPAGYVPNDAFWTRRGYRRVPKLVSQFSWPDVGETASSAKPMTFWLRDLAAAAGG